MPTSILSEGARFGVWTRVWQGCIAKGSNLLLCHLPGVSRRISLYLLRYPILRRSLVSILRRHGVIPGAEPSLSASRVLPAPTLEGLSPRARQVYADIKSTICQSVR